MNMTTLSGLGITVLLSVIATTGCAADADDVEQEEAAFTDSEIIGGGIDTGHPAVAFLQFDITKPNGGNAVSNCTGTLIAPKVILTAAHCVNLKLLEATKILGGRAFFGTNGGAAKPEQFIKMATGKAHPGFVPEANQIDNDIAVVVLESSPPGITPMPFNRKAIPQSAVGFGGVTVGFGTTVGNQDAGGNQKRAVNVKLNSVAANTIKYGEPGATTCQGDSGGPQLFNAGGVQTIVSVTSRGANGCTKEATGARTDRNLPFIDQFLTGGAGATPPNPTPVEPTPTPAPPAGGGFACNGVAEAEPNNSAAQANKVRTGTVCGAVGKQDVDVYTWTGGKAKISFKAQGDARATLRYPGGQQSGSGSFNVQTSNAGVFTFEVSTSSGAPQAYSISFDLD